MSDIELIVKIPEIEYEHLRDKEKFCSLRKSKQEWLINRTLDRVADGTPLPKGHGNLIDISPYKGKVICSHLYSGVIKIIEVDSIEPIIEADRSEENGNL